MDLFDYMREQNMQNESPLANRMRPKTLEEDSSTLSERISCFTVRSGQTS